MIQVVLPWAVVVPDNARTGVVDGRIILSRRYRDAKAQAHLIALLAAKRAGFPVGAVRVVVNVHPPDRRRRDITNTLKLICDALSGAAYADDQQIAELTVHRRDVARANARVVVTVSAIAEGRLL